MVTCNKLAFFFFFFEVFVGHIYSTYLINNKHISHIQTLVISNTMFSTHHEVPSNLHGAKTV